jgi:hypothetical protein
MVRCGVWVAVPAELAALIDVVPEGLPVEADRLAVSDGVEASLEICVDDRETALDANGYAASFHASPTVWTLAPYAAPRIAAFILAFSGLGCGKAGRASQQNPLLICGCANHTVPSLAKAKTSELLVTLSLSP